MKKKIADFLRTKFDEATKTLVKSMAKGAAEDIQEQETKSTILQPDMRVRLTSGHEIFQYNIPQAQISSLTQALKDREYKEDYNIAVKDISYVMRSAHYWLTVDQASKRYYVPKYYSSS